MTEKLTPEEIKKALECCRHDDYDYCEECPYRKNKPCQENLIQDCFDLIDRQQATIETLRKCVEQHHIIRKDGKSPLSLLTAEIRAEAIKEFAEKLIAECDAPHWCVWMSDIDRMLEEMVGDDK